MSVGHLGPLTADGKMIFLPNLFPGDVEINFAGSADTATTRGAGALFTLSRPTLGDTSLEWSFKDWVYVAGGQLVFRECRLGDHLSFKVFAPATIATAAAGNGNANKIAVGGGLNVIVPAAGDGAWSVTDADMIPVPAFNAEGAPNGWWTWDEPAEGKGTVAAAATQTAPFNLFDQPLDLIRWVTKMPILGNNLVDMLLPAIKPKKLLPHWTCRVDLHGEGLTGALTEIAWFLFTARKKTT